MDTRPRLNLSLDHMDLDEVIRGFTAVDNDVMRLQRITKNPYPPSEPKKPQAAPHWEALGSFMNMDPHEVSIIMEHALGNPDDTTRDALRHLLLVSKLQAGEKIGEYRDRCNTVRLDYEQRLAKFNNDVEIANRASTDLNDLIIKRDAVFRSSWTYIVDDFHARSVVADHRIQRMDPGFLRAIRIIVRHSKYAVIRDEAGPDPLLEIQWPFLYKFKGPHINTILKEFKQQNIFVK